MPVADGSVVWLTSGGGPDSDIVFDAQLLTDGDKVAVAGYYSRYARFGATTSPPTNGTLLESRGGLDGYVLTLNVTGEWMQGMCVVILGSCCGPAVRALLK